MQRVTLCGSTTMTCRHQLTHCSRFRGKVLKTACNVPCTHEVCVGSAVLLPCFGTIHVASASVASKPPKNASRLPPPIALQRPTTHYVYDQTTKAIRQEGWQNHMKTFRWTPKKLSWKHRPQMSSWHLQYPSQAFSAESRIRTSHQYRNE